MLERKFVWAYWEMRKRFFMKLSSILKLNIYFILNVSLEKLSNLFEY